MEFRIEETQPKRYIGMVHRGAYQNIGSTWEKVFETAGPKGWATPDTEMIGVYNDDPREVPEDELKSYACISEPREFTGHEGFEQMEIGGGKYLVGTHIGDYSGLGEAWQTVMTKAAEHGHREADHYEKYLVHDMENPEKSVTEIYVPIA